MSLTACITLNDRPVPVLREVYESIRHQAHDQLVIALDRAPAHVADMTATFWKDDPRVTLVPIDGPPGWRSPVKAWNAAYQHVTGAHLYCFSSETVQAEGNLQKAKDFLAKHPNTLLFGKAECSCGPNGAEVNWGGTAPGNLLCSQSHPRPLGFIWAAPFANVQTIGAWDENFDRGFWFDDNDFFTRLWKSGLNFAFTDAVSGSHIHHERPNLTQDGINRNSAYMLQKWASLDPLSKQPRIVNYLPDRTEWKHP